ncbi:hypothetical protein JMJ77_0008906, partial [Colletotrichum scovillei]
AVKSFACHGACPEVQAGPYYVREISQLGGLAGLYVFIQGLDLLKDKDL